ncbi:hypothetical protein JCM15765_14300 [Paradesulfitobacterium aromaticivorans]
MGDLAENEVFSLVLTPPNLNIPFGILCPDQKEVVSGSVNLPDVFPESPGVLRVFGARELGESLFKQAFAIPLHPVSVDQGGLRPGYTSS